MTNLNSELWFFTNGMDTVIAHNIEDAIEVWEEETYENWIDYEDEFTIWKVYEKNPVTLVWVDDEPTQEDVPEGGHVERLDANYAGVVATQEQWIAYQGRGFFSSGEW